MIIEEVILTLRGHVDEAKRLFDSAREQAIKAPSRMESRYDSTREELSWKAEQLGAGLNTMRSLLHELQSMALQRTHASGIVTVGSAVSVRPLGCEGSICDTYFIVPFGGGFDVQYEGKTVFVVSQDAPVAQVILGKGLKDICRVGETDMEIVSIE